MNKYDYYFLKWFYHKFNGNFQISDKKERFFQN